MTEVKKKPGRKKIELTTHEKIEKILELEKKLATQQLDKKERFNTMYKRNKLKRELRKDGHEIPKDMRDLVQPKLTNWNKANAKLSIVDLVIGRLVENEKFQKQFAERVKKFKQMKKRSV